MKLVFAVVLSFMSSLMCSSQVHASASWSHVKIGEIVKVEFCLPQTAKSPVNLQFMGVNGSEKTVAVIHFGRLKSTKACQNEIKYGLNGKNKWIYRLTYLWKTNYIGGNSLQLYIPNLKKVVYGSPDGIAVEKN